MIEAHNITDMEGSSVESAIKNDLGLEIENSEKVINGYSSQVYKANTGEDTVFIRINRDARIFEAEVLGYEIFEQKGIPVPKILAYKKSPPTIGHPTMVMSCAIGTTINEANLSLEEEDIVYEKLGVLLNKINETKLEGYGNLKSKDGKLVGEFPTWEDYRKSIQENDLNASDFCKEKNYITDSEAEKIKKNYGEIASLNFGKASLLHKDLHSSHFFIENTEITGVIDLGGIMAGDPRYDIAMSLVFQNPRQQEKFIKGYGRLAEDPVVNKYLAMILIRKIRFRSKEEIKGNIKPLLTLLANTLKKLD